MQQARKNTSVWEHVGIPCHRSVRQGGGEKAPEDGVRVYSGDFGEGLSGLWKTTRDGCPFQISWEGFDGGGKQLAGNVG